MLSSPTTAGIAPARQKRRFLGEFLRNPSEVGAIAPSSRHLAARMLEGIDLAKVSVAVEYGPGTGAFTGHVARSLPRSARFFAVEINPTLAASVRVRHPGVHVHEASVADIGAVLDREGLPAERSIDLIVSGLPWAIFSEELQRSILSATAKAMKPGATLVTFGYYVGLLSPAARRFAAILPDYFSSIERSRPVWRNLPPAFVLTCKR